MNGFGFTCLHQDAHTQARLGLIHTPHGDIETPAFVPVGTQATVKSLTPQELQELDIHLFFVNTYHMVMRPGLSVIQNAGGLHAFMGWDRPLITDSGGFQVFSLGDKRYARKNDDGQSDTSLVRISDDGVEFRSHWDGEKHMFTPEASMEYQWILGSDIHIAFDDCTPYGVTHKKAKASMERTHRWAERSLSEQKRQETVSRRKNKPYQALYGSIQGSVYEDLRKESAEFITGLPFDGFAIGGVAVGERKEEMEQVLQWVTPHLPPEKPRHLLGVGEVDDIFRLVSYGMDTFDCVGSTRMARTGHVYIRSGTHSVIDILKALYGSDMQPIDPHCSCYTCRHFSRAYLHHLFKVRELLAYRLASIHNIHFIQSLVRDIRLAIQEDRLIALQQEWLGS